MGNNAHNASASERRTEETGDESDLIAACRGGDTRAFADLVRRHKREILAYVARFCTTPAEVDDLAQEAFCRAFEKLHTFRGRSSFRTWLYRIASNACVDHLRSRKRLSRRETQQDCQEQAHTGHGSAQATESRIDCQRLLAHLSPRDRLVVTLLYIDGRSVKETAALSGLSAANVRVRAFRAKARLRSIMEE